MAVVEIDEKASWITPATIESEEFSRIFRFFVVNSPIDGLSSRQISLADHGWKTPWRKPYSLRKQLNHLANNHALIFSAQKYDQIHAEMAKADLLEFPPKDTKKERVCIYNNQRVQYLSVFYHIRNALAHGRFNIIDDVLVMEDAAQRKKWMAPGMKTCSARMVLRISTLINWIELIENGEKEYTS